MIEDEFAIRVQACMAQPIAHDLVSAFSLYQDWIIPSYFRDWRWDKESFRESTEVSPIASINDYQLKSRDIGFEIWKWQPESERESFKALTSGITLQIETLLSLLKKGDRMGCREMEK